MKLIFIVLFFFLQINITHSSKSHTSDNREFYEGRVKFLKEYIDDLKEKQKKNNNIKGSVVETLGGKLYTRLGVGTQEEIDKLALQDCNNDGGLECLIRFRSLKKNQKYNRFAKYNTSKKTLKVLDEFIFAKKVSSTKGIDILIAEKNFKNKNDFNCTKSKSNFKDSLSILTKEINLYPKSFLDNSGLQYVMICEKIIDKGIEPVGMAPGHFDQSPGVFYININRVNSYGKNKAGIVKHVFHHEFFHVIDTALTTIYLDDKWNNLNQQSYSEELLIDKNVIDNSVKGYISKYARNNLAEDKAELFAFMITQHNNFKQVISKDEILLKKSKLMISRLKKISNKIDKNFWKKLN